jgi:hypothetical protein
MNEINSTDSSKFLEEKDDPVNSPSHYNMLSIEAIDIIEMSMTREEFLGYLKGNVLKYVIRYKHKGNPRQDLSKALWYLTKLEETIKEKGK